MVAYSFQKRFAPPILAGTKPHTIRADRRRHARPGEMIQLYTGMRTKHCRKIRPDVPCLSVEPILLRWFPDLLWDVVIGGARHSLSSEDMNAFARADGFADRRDMALFWTATHGHDVAGELQSFNGFLIRWEPNA